MAFFAHYTNQLIVFLLILQLCPGWSVDVLMAIFDLSFSAIPDLHKQAEDIDFFHEEYRK